MLGIGRDIIRGPTEQFTQLSWGESITGLRDHNGDGGVIFFEWDSVRLLAEQRTHTIEKWKFTISESQPTPNPGHPIRPQRCFSQYPQNIQVPQNLHPYRTRWRQRPILPLPAQSVKEKNLIHQALIKQQ